MTRRLKILLAALILEVLVTDLVQLCGHCMPEATPPATAKEIGKLRHSPESRNRDLADSR